MLALEEIKHYLNAESLSSEDMWHVIEALGIELEDESNVMTYFEMLKDTLDTAINDLQSITFDKEFGFNNFTQDQLLTFYLEPSQFALSLNKEKGKGLLYGADHVRVRQSVFNHLPPPLRNAILQKKCDYFAILPHCLSLFDNIDTTQGFSIKDVIDIGMSHSIYRITLDLGQCEKQIVLKEEELPHQPFFCQLLKELNWSNYQSIHVEDQLKSWEISEYLGPKSVQDHLLMGDVDLNNLVPQLAAHAALGDLLGRGDRHLENYMVKDRKLLPIDISYLFWPDNEHWTQEYVRGGMYEINALIYFENGLNNQGLFFQEYRQTMRQLIEKKEVILSVMNQFFSKQDQQTRARIAYVEGRFNDIDTFIETQVSAYKESLTIFNERLKVKTDLENLYERDSKTVFNHPKAKMYYLANKDRCSSFYLISEDDFIELKRFIAKHS